MEDWIDFNGHSISIPDDVDYQDIHITERIGESIGLAVVNRIHDLSEADWDRIPEQGGRMAPPVFDYQIASDGTSIIQVEAKGSSVDNNENKASTVSNHKSEIINRKSKIAELESNNSYHYPANLRYGTITVMDTRRDGSVRCWLVDPEPESVEIQAAKLRLINRMRFLRDWISFIGPRSQIASSLSTRVADLETLSNPFELDSIPLLKGTGDPFKPISSPFRTDYTLSFLFGKSHVTDGPTSGVVTQVLDNALFFLGIRNEIAVIATEQNFNSILSNKFFTGVIKKTVNCIIPKNRFKRLDLPNWVREEAKKKGDYVSFKLEGELMYNQDGLVFGILPMEV